MSDDRTEGMKFDGFLGVLRRRITIVIACLLLVPAITLVYTATQAKKYTASADILLEDPGLESSVVSNVAAPASSAQDIATLVDTTVTVANLPAIAKRTAAKLGGRVTAGDVSGAISVTPAGSGRVVTVTSTHGDPRKAAAIGTAYAQEFVGFLRDILRSRILEARQKLAGQPALRSRESELTALAALQTGNARVVQPAAVPSGPSSPKPVKNLIAGVGLGLLLGVSLALLFELLDRRLNKPEEVETLFGRPIVGAIPHSPALASSGAEALELPPSDKESFRLLQTKLSYFNEEQSVRSVVVTSAASGDGKSTVAWNVAVAAADAGGRILLIEADLRAPQLASRFNIVTEDGLSDVLSGRSELSDVVHQVPIAVHGDNGKRTTSSMDVVFAGPRPSNPSQLIESRRMGQLMREAEAVYDLVIIDTPPPSIVSDAIPIIKRASGVLVVARLRKSTRTELSHLRDQLRNLNAVTLGVAVNSMEATDGYYGSLYGAARDYAPAAAIDEKAS